MGFVTLTASLGQGFLRVVRFSVVGVIALIHRTYIQFPLCAAIIRRTSGQIKEPCNRAMHCQVERLVWKFKIVLVPTDARVCPALQVSYRRDMSV